MLLRQSDANTGVQSYYVLGCEQFVLATTGKGSTPLSLAIDCYNDSVREATYLKGFSVTGCDYAT